MSEPRHVEIEPAQAENSPTNKKSASKTVENKSISDSTKSFLNKSLNFTFKTRFDKRENDIML